jgi:two-component system, OmpR family, sensor kinase
MHHDDRLNTVLRHRPAGAGAARTQLRQLLDLLGTLPNGARSNSVDAAYLRLSELTAEVEPHELATMIEDPGLRLRSPRLVAQLAQESAPVAAAAIRAGRLSPQEWLDLVPALPLRARGFMRQRRDLGEDAERLLAALGVHDRGLPPGPVPAAIAEPAPDPSAAEGIAALVKRIEAFRKTRQPAEPANDRSSAPRLPLGEEPTRRRSEAQAFDFACDAGGRITWTDPGVAPMVVGRELLAEHDPAALPMIDAIRRLQPIRGARLRLDGASAIAGDWQVDAAPRFDPVGGRLLGWHGRFRRTPAPAAQSPSPADLEADRIRQLLHELRTPVNAIQGYSEAMQQGLFGPILHEYRALSAAIAADAARILAGFDELERLVRLDSGTLELEPGEADFAGIVRRTAAHLDNHTAGRGAGFDSEIDSGPLPVALAEPEAERIAWRLLATLAGAAGPEERLRLRLRRRRGMARLTVRLPATLAAKADAELFRAGVGGAGSGLSAGSFGTGFALRLVAAEARAAGGWLERRDDRLRLEIAGLTRQTVPHSQAGEAEGHTAA